MKDIFEEVIQVTLKKRIGEEADKAIAVAKKSVEEAILKEVDRFALELLKYYSIQDCGTHLKIIVEKKI